MSATTTGRPRNTARRDELLGSLYTALMAVAFGAVVILGKALLSNDLPFTLLALRFGGSALVLAPILAATRRPLLPERGERLGIVVAGTLGYGVEAALFFGALNYGNAAAVTLLFYTYPVLVMLLAWGLDRRAPARMLFLALAFASGGTAIVVVGGAGVEVEPLGIALALACACAYTGYLTGAARVMRRTNPMTAAMWLAAMAATANIVFALVTTSWRWPQGNEWWSYVGMWAATASAFVFMMAGLQRIGAVRNAIIGVMEPLAVALLAWIFLTEPISATVAVGGALILAGAVVATLSRSAPTVEPTL